MGLGGAPESFVLKEQCRFSCVEKSESQHSAGESGRLRPFKNYLQAEPSKTGINLHRCIILLLPTSSVFFRSGESHTLLHTCLVNLSVSQGKKRWGSASFFKHASPLYAVCRGSKTAEHKSHFICLNSEKVCATPLSL